MGQEVQQDRAIPLPMVHALIDALNLEWQSADSKQNRELVVLLGAYMLIATGIALMRIFTKEDSRKIEGDSPGRH
jgi:hypothetical protein